jgi:hypothetical protein
MGRRWLLWIAVPALCYAASVSAQPELTFTVNSHKTPPKGISVAAGQAPKPSDESFSLTVVLGAQYLSIEGQGQRTIYDFANTRMLQLNLLKRTYEDHSLYALVEFKAAEFINRLMLAKMLQSGKLSVPSMNPVQLEHFFSLRSPELMTHLDRHDAGGESTFSWQDQQLAVFSNKTRALPAGFQSAYWRFLRYYAGVHPEIYAALAPVQGVPEHVTLMLQNMQIERRELVLRTITDRPDGPYSLEGFTLTTPAGSPYPTLALLDSQAASQLEQRAEQASRDLQSFMDQGRVFDALLALMAHLIMTGDSAAMQSWSQEHKAAIEGDDHARVLMASLNSQDKEAAKEAAKSIAGLRQSEQPYGYMLDVFEGNARLSSQDGPGGSDKLLAALAANPYLLGAWKDLGSYYYKRFEAVKAWDCWDAARKVDPKHPMLRDISQIEQTLRFKFPEYF